MTTQALQTTDQSAAVVPADVSAGALQSALAGDLKRLTTEDRLKYYGALCQMTGLNPLSKPFDWLELQGKLILYANKGCAEQLRKLHKVSVDIVERKVEFGCLIVRVKATSEDGRHDESIAAVPFAEGMAPDAKANAMMKVETKAKRRVTLSICGLGMLDESEIDNVKGAQIAADLTNGADSAEARADKLNARLTAGEKVEAIDAEVIPPKPEPLPAADKQPEQTVPQPPVVAESGAPVSATAAPATADEAFLCELETVLSENPSSVNYLVAQGKLQNGAGLLTLDRAYAERILKFPKKFLAAVDTWAKGGSK